jgi:hypothetical protein
MEGLKTLKRKYSDPTPRHWRKIGDFALILMVVIEGYLPQLPLSESQHSWATFAVALLGASIKFWTNTKSVHK